MINPVFITKKNALTESYGQFVMEPLPQSFGNSLGNALRRTLSSSLKGSAITSVKISGIPHLFSTLKGVKESGLELTLNLKQLRFKTSGEGPFKAVLSAKGAGKLYGKNVEGEIEIVNKDHYIGEITDDKVKLDIEMIIEVGYGFSPTEERETKEYGFIPVDAFFSPVKKVNFKVEEARVGRKSNFDRLILDIWTDGSIKPDDALRESSHLLAQYFSHVLSGRDTPVVPTEKDEIETKKDEVDKKLYEIIIDELDLPSRVINALLRENIETVADLIKAGREKLGSMKGVGKKSIELIVEELKKMGIQMN